ncbi:Fic family protein [Lutispora thermophila]|uniref:Fic family protein n=1 Tax=Lutispora thermophila DSM 19022 TaxID=1122184 RepID=A0A1M6IPL0_9FIRM|nr:Fic family protein [Lutispora thermophila]SHJ36372.1 Fic family protein [Lutispora thermophila DSM 19022]
MKKRSFERIDYLKGLLDDRRPLDKVVVDKLKEYYKVEIVYNSNAIEGNTLTRFETKMVIEQGLTIGEKGLKNYLEAVNLSEAMDFIEELVSNKEPLTETVLKQIHYIVLKETVKYNSQYAGTYRNLPVEISGSDFKPPQPYLVQPQMEELFQWYGDNKNRLHPVELAALFHFKLVSIHPFIDGNGRTARLIMNFILMQNGYPPAVVKADEKDKAAYYKTLEHGQTTGDVEPFIEFICTCVEKTLEGYLERIGVIYDKAESQGQAFRSNRNRENSLEI